MEIDSNIPCRKASVAKQRKFLAGCGGKVTFNLDRSGSIVSVKPEHKKCEQCKDTMKNAVKIIFKSS